jgi:uncharacterized protein YcfJ
MFKKLIIAAAAIAMTAGGVVPATVSPAEAQGWREREYRQQQRYYDRDYRRYNNRRAAQRCRDGDGGTIVGAIAGGLLGRAVAGRGDRLLGTVLGAGGGALAGRAIDRSDRPGYCRR